jgi:hypothetical protein
MPEITKGSIAKMISQRTFYLNNAIHESMSSGRKIHQFNSLKGQRFFEKNSENAFSPENGWIVKLMVPSESAPQELSIEWSCQYMYV